MKSKQSFRCCEWFLIVAAAAVLPACGDDRGSSPGANIDRGGPFADAARDGAGDGSRDGGDASGDASKDVAAATDGKLNGDTAPAGDAMGATEMGPNMTAACEACEKSMCRAFVLDGQPTDFYGACMEATGTIKQGNAQGELKKDVCLEILACIRNTNCADIANPALGGQPCYCGKYAYEDCIKGMADGPCKTEFEDGAESVKSAEVAERINDPLWAVGAAVSMAVICDGMACSSACLGTPGTGGAGGSGTGGMGGSAARARAGTRRAPAGWAEAQLRARAGTRRAPAGWAVAPPGRAAAPREWTPMPRAWAARCPPGREDRRPRGRAERAAAP